jgi:hypothetical protein
LTDAVRLPFSLNALEGVLLVRIDPNDDPASVGSTTGSRGLPICTARVQASSRGYNAMCGWIQVVRSTDNASGGAEFELDPFGPFTDTGSPYAFYGLAPTLFDAPGRDERDDLDWTAHAWLARTELDSRLVEPAVGFSWGFRIRQREARVSPVARLSMTDWAEHVPLVQRQHPRWTIADGL